MSAMGRLAGGLMLLAGAARGFTTDDYYSVQSGYWDQASTWTSPAPMAFGYPRTGDTANVFHDVMATAPVSCANAYVTGRVAIGSSGQWDIYNDATFVGARIAGPGPFKTRALNTWEGRPSHVDAPWFNVGEARFQTPSLQLENDFYNDGGTVVVDRAEFSLYTTSGTGRVVNNQGAWQIRSGATCTVAQFESMGQLRFTGGTGSAFRTVGHCRLAGGTWQLDEGARFIPASTDCTAHVDGEYVSTGNGQWHLEGGTTYVSHVSATTTAFTGGTYYWRAGEIDVHPSGQLENRGEIQVAANAWTQTLYGLLLNKGRLRLATTSGPGYVEFGGTWQNAAGGTTIVESADFRWRGTGTFENAGTFRVADGLTGSTDNIRFRMMGGLIQLGTATVYQIRGNRQQHAGGGFWLGTGAVCQVVCGGTDYWDGVYTATGDGELQMDGGTLMASHYSMTTTVFAATGGGFRVQGGTFNVRSPYALENRGVMRFASTSTPFVLQGNFRNQGRVYYGMTSGPCLLSGPGAEIVNRQTGVWSFVEEGGAIDPLSYGFNNYGTVNYQAATVSVAGWYFNQAGATTSLRRGTARFTTGFAANGGRLHLDGGTCAGNVYLMGMGGDSGILSGTGTVTGYVNQMDGTLAPGHSPGALSIGDRYEQGSNATLQIEIGGKMPGTEYDQLRVASDASVKGTLAVELYDGYLPAAGRRFDVLRCGTLSPSGFFSATNLPALPPGTDWLLLYRTNGVQLRVATATDADGDGLQDDWETVHFGDTTSHDGGEEDDDGDGYTDYVEQCLGTQPTNNADFFRAGEIAVAGSNSLLELRTGSLAWYAIEVRPDLSDSVGEWTVVDEFFGTGGTIVRTNAAGGDLRFYRLKAVAP